MDEEPAAPEPEPEEPSCDEPDPDEPEPGPDVEPGAEDGDGEGTPPSSPLSTEASAVLDKSAELPESLDCPAEDPADAGPDAR